MIVWTAVNECSVRCVLTSSSSSKMRMCSSHHYSSLFTLILATPATVLCFALPLLYVKFCIVVQAPSREDHVFFLLLLIKIRIDPLQGNTREAPSGNFQCQFSPTCSP